MERRPAEARSSDRSLPCNAQDSECTELHLDIVLVLNDIFNYSEHTRHSERRGKDSRYTYCIKYLLLNGIQRRCKLLQSYSVGVGE